MDAQTYVDGKLMSGFICTPSFINRYLIKPKSGNQQIMMFLIAVEVLKGF